ncbi:unnamed protein product [Dibothriocephalus latus]|uniref:Uncharacterized protein n=1 Tax=Dibothriocephalus latus TaxID=60516 RepID=A0A3P7REW4_DIBLA|nr:unnamed protein product [Dibothriocephalus latus]
MFPVQRRRQHPAIAFAPRVKISVHRLNHPANVWLLPCCIRCPVWRAVCLPMHARGVVEETLIIAAPPSGTAAHTTVTYFILIHRLPFFHPPTHLF